MTTLRISVHNRLAYGNARVKGRMPRIEHQSRVFARFDPDRPANDRTESYGAQKHKEVDLGAPHGHLKFIHQIKRVVAGQARQIDEF